MWGSILQLFANVSGMALNSLVMKHVNEYARLEKEKLKLEDALYDNENDVKYVKVVKAMGVEKRAIEAQLSLMKK